jgi:hypothetical protein
VDYVLDALLEEGYLFRWSGAVARKGAEKKLTLNAYIVRIGSFGGGQFLVFQKLDLEVTTDFRNSLG